MTKTQLQYLCTTYGDKSLSENEKWKSIYSFSTCTTKMPTFAFQYYLSRNMVSYVEDGVNEPGFAIISHKPAHSGIDSYKKRICTFIPLSSIIAVSVLPKLTEKDPEPPEDDIILLDALDANDEDDQFSYEIEYDNGAVDDTNIRIYDAKQN